MSETCFICGRKMRRSCEIRIFERTWRKKVKYTCPKCGAKSQDVVILRGKRKPGNAIQTAVAVAKLGESEAKGGAQ